jgi:cell division protein FtsZ
MSGMGVAMMGTGIAEGEGRSMTAAQKAVSSPLLEDSSVNGARGVIINVTGGPDLSLMEVNEASSIIQEAAHEDANIIFGAVVDPNLVGKVKITVIATGFDRKGHSREVSAAALQTPVDLHTYTAHVQATEQTEPVAPPAVLQAAPQLTLNRRPGVDLSLPRIAQGSEGSAGPREELNLDVSSPFDVPAFLRRQS